MSSSSDRGTGQPARWAIRPILAWIVRAAVAGFLAYQVSVEAGIWTAVTFLVVWTAFVALDTQVRAIWQAAALGRSAPPRIGRGWFRSSAANGRPPMPRPTPRPRPK